MVKLAVEFHPTKQNKTKQEIENDFDLKRSHLGGFGRIDFKTAKIYSCQNLKFMNISVHERLLNMFHLFFRRYCKQLQMITDGRGFVFQQVSSYGSGG